MIYNGYNIGSKHEYLYYNMSYNIVFPFIQDVNEAYVIIDNVVIFHNTIIVYI